LRFLAAFLCFIPALALADAAQDLKARLDEIHSLKGRFNQLLSDKNGKPLQSTSGEFAVKRPGYFLWQSEAPYEQTVIGTPEKVWVYDPDLEQVTIRKAQNEADGNPARLLSGDLSEIRSTYEVSLQTADGASRFQLVPKDANSPYRHVEFEFKGSQLAGLDFKDKLGQQTQIKFEQVQPNADIPSSVFVFNPPPGTDVIVDE